MLTQPCSGIANVRLNRLRPLLAAKQVGLTLIELLIALGIGLLVVAAVAQLFVGSKVTFNATEALARAQESGRFAVATISPAVRSAGLNGICGGSARLLNHLNLSPADASTLLSPAHAIRGWEYRGTGIGQTVTLDNLDPAASGASDWLAGGNIGDLPDAIATRALPLSDVLLIREMRPIANITAVGGNAANANSPNQATINVTGPHSVNQCEIILMTNCNQADLFQVSSVSSTSVTPEPLNACSPGNIALDWSASYASATQFYRPQSRAFFVGEGAARQPAMFSATFGLGLTAPRIEELVDGIENMQVLFGYSEPGPPEGSGDGQSVNIWLTAQNVPNWEYVIAVQIGLLARAPGSVGAGAAAQTFNVALTNVTHSADTLLRQPHNVTLSLRNRQIVR